MYVAFGATSGNHCVGAGNWTQVSCKRSVPLTKKPFFQPSEYVCVCVCVCMYIYTLTHTHTHTHTHGGGGEVGLFVFQDRVSLWTHGCPGTCSVDQADLELIGDLCYKTKCIAEKHCLSYRPGCPGTHSIDQAGLKLRNLPASASQVLGLKACSTTAQPQQLL